MSNFLVCHSTVCKHSRYNNSIELQNYSQYYLHILILINNNWLYKYEGSFQLSWIAYNTASHRLPSYVHNIIYTLTLNNNGCVNLNIVIYCNWYKLNDVSISYTLRWHLYVLTMNPTNSWPAWIWRCCPNSVVGIYVQCVNTHSPTQCLSHNSLFSLLPPEFIPSLPLLWL